METYLSHHGIKGQKWGVRRYQNADGTLTSDGKKHYGLDKLNSNNRKDISNLSEKDRINHLRKEKYNLHEQINRNNPIDRDAIYQEAQRRYDKKVKQGKVEYNPDDWDYEYEERELAKWDKVNAEAHREVDRYLEKKYNITMSEFEKSEKDRITKADKYITNVEKGLLAVAAASLPIIMAMGIKKDLGK